MSSRSSVDHSSYDRFADHVSHAFDAMSGGDYMPRIDDGTTTLNLREVNLTKTAHNQHLFNEYRGGTSDATTLSSLIVSLIKMSFDDFLPSKTALFVVQK